MGISYDEALMAQRAIEDKLLDDPNVVSIGVVEEKDAFGQKTGDYAIRVGVISAEVYQQALNHGQSIIPSEYRLSSEAGANKTKNVHIQVVKTGRIDALSVSDAIGSKNLPSAIDVISPTTLQSFVNKMGYPNDLADAEIGMTVEKTGRTTGYTQGKVISVSQTVKINYGKFGLLKFKNQICTTSLSKGGDSGSCLFAAGIKKPIGLLFAGDSSESFHNPIKSVLSSLSMSYSNKYSSGSSHLFQIIPPLKILRRNYSTTTTAFIKQRGQLARISLDLSMKLRPMQKGLLMFTAMAASIFGRIEPPSGRKINQSVPQKPEFKI